MFIIFKGPFKELKNHGFEYTNHEQIIYFKKRNCILKREGLVHLAKNPDALNEHFLDILKDKSQTFPLKQGRKPTHVFYIHTETGTITIDSKIVKDVGRQIFKKTYTSIIKSARYSDQTEQLYIKAANDVWEEVHIDHDFLNDLYSFYDKGWLGLKN
jgi:hypothetical protein